MISKIPIWSQSIKPISLKEQHNKPFHLPHRSDSNLGNEENTIPMKSSKYWKIIYISTSFIVFRETKDQKITYLYDQQSYLTYPSYKIYQFCMQYSPESKMANLLEPKLIQKAKSIYLFSIGKCQRYQIDIFTQGMFRAIYIDTQKPLYKQDIVYSSNTYEIVIFGRKLPHQFEITSMLWAYDIQNNKWKEIDDRQLVKKFQENEIQNPQWYLLDGNILSIIYMTYILQYQVQQKQILRKLPIKIENPIKTCISTKIGFSNLLLCINNQNLFLIQSNKTLKHIDMGIFLDNTVRWFTGITFSQRDIKLYGEIQAQTSDQPTFISIKSWSIELSQLSEVKDQHNFPLSFYFNKKNYSDLAFLIENRQIYCSRVLFEHYSPKFKKIYVNSMNNINSTAKSKTNQSITVKIDNVKYPTLYFLIEELYNNFNFGNRTNFDEQTFLQLMFLANKFQIKQVMTICQQNIPITHNNFSQICIYSKNNQTQYLNNRLLEYLVHNYQQVVKNKKISPKLLEELIRNLYTPTCQHVNKIQLKSNVSNYYTIKNKKNQNKYDRSENINGLVENGHISMNICEKCYKIIGFDGVKSSRYKHHRYKYS